VRAGAILPRAVEGTRAAETTGPLVVSVFPGDDGEGWLYEDAGDDGGYRRGEHRRTSLRAGWSGGGRRLRVEVGPAAGTFSGAPPTRDLHVRVHGTPPPLEVAVGDPGPRRAEHRETDWHWSGERMELEIRVVDVPVTETLELRVVFPELPDDAPHGVPGLLRRLREAVDRLQSLWPIDAAPDALVRIAQTGRRMSLRPDRALDELRDLGVSLPTVVEGLSSVRGDPAPIAQARALLEPWMPRGRP